MILVGGGVVRTVAGEPTFASAGVLGAIVAIGTLLSNAIEVAIEGRRPWCRHGRPGEA